LAVAFAVNAARRATAIVIIVLFGWTVLSHRQARIWHDTNRLMARVVEVNERSWVGHSELAKQALARGDTKTGVRMLQHALELRPGDPALLNDLGTALQDDGQVDLAETTYRQTIRIAPWLAEPWSNLGGLLAEQGKLDEAIDCYHEALKRNSNNRDAQVGLRRALAERAATRPAL
jgi:Flp pilus assembly protein TadD